MSAKINPPTPMEMKGLIESEQLARREKRKRHQEILMGFEITQKTETAFYLQFQKLPEADREYLQGWYELPDADWSVFKMITKYWNVRIA